MILSASSSNKDDPNYVLLRHLFTAATHASLSDKSWQISSTFSDPEKTMFTEYYHPATGDTISCQSFGYADGKYNKHLFTFKQPDRLFNE